MPKQNYDLVNKYMKLVIHDKMKTFKSEPTSNQMSSRALNSIKFPDSIIHSEQNTEENTS